MYYCHIESNLVKELPTAFGLASFKHFSGKDEQHLTTTHIYPGANYVKTEDEYTFSNYSVD